MVTVIFFKDQPEKTSYVNMIYCFKTVAQFFNPAKEVEHQNRSKSSNVSDRDFFIGLRGGTGQ